MTPSVGTLEPAGAAATVTAVPLQVDVGELAFLVLFFALGLFMVYKGFDEYRVSRLIRDTATETVRSVAVGRTELTGTAVPADTVFHRPFTDGECVYAHYTIREHDDSGSEGSDWTTVDTDTWVAPFYLEDGTGRIRVEPEVTAKFEISEGNTTTITVDAGQSPPPEIRAFLDDVASASPSSEKRKYVEEVIPPEASVYVLGGAEERDGADGANEDRLVVRRDGGSDRFVISDMTQDELASTLTYRAPLLILVGLAISTVCLYVLLDTVGIA